MRCQLPELLGSVGAHIDPGSFFAVEQLRRGPELCCLVLDEVCIGGLKEFCMHACCICVGHHLVCSVRDKAPCLSEARRVEVVWPLLSDEWNYAGYVIEN